MATPERIENLRRYCEQWKELLASAGARRTDLLNLKSSGVSISDGERDDVLDQMIAECDSAVRTYAKIEIYMQSLYSRALSGDDV